MGFYVLFMYHLSLYYYCNDLIVHKLKIVLFKDLFHFGKLIPNHFIILFIYDIIPYVKYLHSISDVEKGNNFSSRVKY